MPSVYLSPVRASRLTHLTRYNRPGDTSSSPGPRRALDSLEADLRTTYSRSSHRPRRHASASLSHRLRARSPHFSASPAAATDSATDTNSPRALSRLVSRRSSRNPPQTCSATFRTTIHDEPVHSEPGYNKPLRNHFHHPRPSAPHHSNSIRNTAACNHSHTGRRRKAQDLR
jgi:hypothetical protein